MKCRLCLGLTGERLGTKSSRSLMPPPGCYHTAYHDRPSCLASGRGQQDQRSAGTRPSATCGRPDAARAGSGRLHVRPRVLALDDQRASDLVGWRAPVCANWRSLGEPAERAPQRPGVESHPLVQGARCATDIMALHGRTASVGPVDWKSGIGLATEWWRSRGPRRYSAR